MPVWFWRIALNVVAAIVSWLLRPKQESPKPATLSDFNVPRAQEGAFVPKIYGFVWVKTAQVAWFGHFKSRAIRQGGKK